MTEQERLTHILHNVTWGELDSVTLDVLRRTPFNVLLPVLLKLVPGEKFRGVLVQVLTLPKDPPITS